MFGSIFYWLKHPVAEVPEELSYCEFECGETECGAHDWCRCTLRQNAGALEQPEQGRN